MKTPHLAAGLATLAALAACGGPTADTSAPTISFAASGRTFYSNEGGASNRTCPGGLAPAYNVFAPDSDFIHVRDGGQTAQLTVTFSDPSGIQRAFLQIPAGQLRSPQVSRTVPIPTPTGGLSQVYEYNFYGQGEAPETTHRVNVDLTHSDDNRIFNVFATDFEGNTTQTVNVVVGEASNLCAG